MDNRQPTKQWRGFLVLVFLPIVGIVLYIFFGQNIRKERFISQRSLDKLSNKPCFEYIEQQTCAFRRSFGFNTILSKPKYGVSV